MQSRFIILLLAATAGLAQNPNTASFPSAILTDSVSTVAKDRSRSILTASINSSVLSVVVSTGDGPKFTVDELITIDDEQMRVCGVSGDTLTICSGTRGFSHTDAVSHSNGANIAGNITEWHINQANAEIKAIQTLMGVNGASLMRRDADNTTTAEYTTHFTPGATKPGFRAGCGPLPSSPGAGGVLHCNSDNANHPYWYDGSAWTDMYSTGGGGSGGAVGFERTGTNFSIDSSLHGFTTNNLIVSVYDFDTANQVLVAVHVGKTSPYAVTLAGNLPVSRHMWVVISSGGGGGGSGSGDVTGGSASTFGEVASYSDTTGKVIGRSYIAFSGPASSTKSFTLPNTSSAILTDSALVTVAQGGTGLSAGTSGGIPYFSAVNALLSSGALTLNMPVLGGGAGASPTVGTVQGNTTKFVTYAGSAPATNDCAKFDSSGNLTTNGAGCGGGGSLTDGDKGDITVTGSGATWTIDNSTITDAKVVTGIDAAKIADGSVSNAEFQYINTVTSNVQTQLSAKAASGANTDITSILLNQTGLSIKGATAFALTIKPNETLTAARTLNVITHDADRTIDLSGNLTVTGAASISGTNTGDQTFDGLSPTTTRGDLIVRGASSNVRLAKGSQYQVLTGGVTDPTWGAVALDQSTAVSGIAGSANGGTGNGFTKFTGATTSEKIYTLPNTNATIAYTIGSGSTALSTSALASLACVTTTTSVPGMLTTDSYTAVPNADLTTVTGYAPSLAGHIEISTFPTVDNINFRQCNQSASSITPSAVTINWSVRR